MLAFEITIDPLRFHLGSWKSLRPLPPRAHAPIIFSQLWHFWARLSSRFQIWAFLGALIWAFRSHFCPGKSLKAVLAVNHARLRYRNWWIWYQATMAHLHRQCHQLRSGWLTSTWVASWCPCWYLKFLSAWRSSVFWILQQDTLIFKRGHLGSGSRTFLEFCSYSVR